VAEAEGGMRAFSSVEIEAAKMGESALAVEADPPAGSIRYGDRQFSAVSPDEM